MDFGLMMKFGGLWGKFTKNHPKFPQFMKALQSNGISDGTIIDIKITYPDGHTVDSNLKINESDIQIFEELKKIKK